MGQPLVIFDLETGGLELTHPIIQIGATAEQNGKELACFEAKIKVDIAACEPEALKINSYDEKLWTDEAVDEKVAFEGFATFLSRFATVKRTSKGGNAYTVARLGGFNIATFDIPRIRARFDAHDMFFPGAGQVIDFYHYACLLFLARDDWPEKLTLDALCKQFQIKQGNHDALGDSRSTAALGRKIIEALRRVLDGNRAQNR